MQADEAALRRDGANFSYVDDGSSLRQAIFRAVEVAGGQRRLRRLYEEEASFPARDETFFAAAVRALAVDVDYSPAALARVPAEGPVVFVANHPYGVLDGIVLAWLAHKARPDARLLAHRALFRVPEARPYLLPVDFNDGAAAAATNLASRREARRRLAEGGAICLFPAGGVATTPKATRRAAYDLPWHPFAASLVRGAAATVVPVYFGGQNSLLFQIASHLSQTLRLSLLFHETARRIGTSVAVRVGDPIAHRELAHFGRDELVRELRRRTLALAPRPDDWTIHGRLRPRRERAAPLQPCRIISSAKPGPLP